MIGLNSSCNNNCIKVSKLNSINSLTIIPKQILGYRYYLHVGGFDIFYGRHSTLAVTRDWQRQD
jgi:hypothetical protein